MADAFPCPTIPRVHTARLTLREQRMTDFDAFARNLADPLAHASRGGVVDRREAWRHFTSGPGCWMLTGRGWWAVEQRSEPGLVGTVGVFAREGFPDPFEIGWVTLRPFCGRGFATEAARGALGFAFDTWNADRVVAYIDDDNAPSLRVARAVGLVPDRKVDFYDTRLMRFVLDRPAFGG